MEKYTTAMTYALSQQRIDNYTQQQSQPTIAQTKYKQFHSFWLWKRDIITRNYNNTLLENEKYMPKNEIEQIAQGL